MHGLTRAVRKGVPFLDDIRKAKPGAVLGKLPKLPTGRPSAAPMPSNVGGGAPRRWPYAVGGLAAGGYAGNKLAGGGGFFSDLGQDLGQGVGSAVGDAFSEAGKGVLPWVVVGVVAYYVITRKAGKK